MAVLSSLLPLSGLPLRRWDSFAASKVPIAKQTDAGALLQDKTRQARIRWVVFGRRQSGESSWVSPVVLRPLNTPAPTFPKPTDLLHV